MALKRKQKWWIRDNFRIGPKRRRFLGLMICIVSSWDFRQRLLWLGKRKFKDFSIILLKDVLDQMQFGIFFIKFFFKEFIRSNFYVRLFNKSSWLTNNVVYLYNFYCICEDWFTFSDYFLNELNFRFIEIVNFLTRYIVWPWKLDYFYKDFFNYCVIDANYMSVKILHKFYIKVDIFSFLFLKEDLEFYRRLKYWEYINQLNLYFFFNPYYRFFFLEAGNLLLGQFFYSWYIWAVLMQNFRIYSISTSFLNISYYLNPAMIFLTFNSFISVFSKDVRQTFNFVLKKNILLILRLSLYLQSLHLYERFKMVSYSGMHRHAIYNNICNTLFGMDDCCIESFCNLSSKYEKKLFFLDNKKFRYYYFFIDLVNYGKFLGNNFLFLSNKIFNNILSLQFVEYYSIALERTLFSSVGSSRVKKKRNLFLGMEYFFFDFWDLGYIYFHDVELIFRFVSMNLDFLNLLIVDYFIWSLDFNFGFKSKDLSLNDYLFREGVFDFRYCSRLNSYFEFFGMNVNNRSYFVNSFFNFKIYFVFLSIRDFLFSIIRWSSRLSICYYFLLNILGLVVKENSYKLMRLNLPSIFFKKKYIYSFLDYYLWWSLDRSLKSF
jgi:hypothetical protein